jgi:hypothetical protein
MAYAVNCVPFYDTRQQQYTKILCVNAAPTGPLAARVQLIRPPRLSGLCLGFGTDRCIHAITSFSGSGSGSGYMTPDDLPELFAFLATNGYTVDTGLTKLAAKHQSGDAGSLVCIISYHPVHPKI